MKKLRFKQEDGTDYPDWEKSRFGEVAERVTRKNTGHETDNNLTISAEHGLISQTEFFTKTIASKDNSGYFLIRKGEFAYNKSTSASAPVGATKILKRYDKGAVSPLYICFRTRESSLLPSFVEQLVESTTWSDEIRKIATEGARNHGLLNVSPTDFFNMSVPLPSLPEQKKIATFLGLLDERIEAQRALVSGLEQEKRGYMQAMLSPAPTLRFKQEDGTDYPDWEKTKLGEILSSRGSGSLSKKAINHDGENRIVLYGELYTTYGERITGVSTRTAVESGVEINYGDILTPTSGESPWDIARASAFLSSAANKTLSGGDMAIFTPRTGASSSFLAYLMNSHSVRSQVAVKAQGNSVVHVSRKVWEGVDVMLPAFPEQKKIATFLGLLDDRIEAEQVKLTALEIEKRAFAQRVFL